MWSLLASWLLFATLNHGRDFYLSTDVDNLAVYFTCNSPVILNPFWSLDNLPLQQKSLNSNSIQVKHWVEKAYHHFSMKFLMAKRSLCWPEWLEYSKSPSSNLIVFLQSGLRTQDSSLLRNTPCFFYQAVDFFNPILTYSSKSKYCMTWTPLNEPCFTKSTTGIIEWIQLGLNQPAN